MPPALDGGAEALARLGRAYAVAGRRMNALKAIGELKELLRQRFASAHSIAIVYAGFGEKDQAFAWFEKVLEDHSELMSQLKFDGKFDPLHSNPRFFNLLRRMNFAQ